jgi:hypothetical protein
MTLGFERDREPAKAADMSSNGHVSDALRESLPISQSWFPLIP